jgi:7-keto-8-aminopelargonate synthetase-like enzyme
MNPSIFYHGSFAKALANIGALILWVVSVCDLNANRLAVYITCVPSGVLEV